MRKEIIVFIILSLFCSCISAVPIMNNSVPMKENQERVVLSGGLGKLYIQDDNNYSLLVTNKGESSNAPVFYGSFKRQLEDFLSFELFTFGLRITEDIYKDMDLYISCFQSVHLLGGNIGMIFASVNQEINKYASFRVEYNVIETPIESDGTGKYFNIIPSLGLNFTEGKYINFIEYEK